MIQSLDLLPRRWEVMWIYGLFTQKSILRHKLKGFNCGRTTQLWSYDTILVARHKISVSCKQTDLKTSYLHRVRTKTMIMPTFPENNKNGLY
jgi:hypothetical protein